MSGIDTSPVKVPVVPDTAPREVSDPAVKLVTIPVVALKVAAVVIPAISTPVGDSVTVPTPDRLLILSTLISDAIWVHFPPLVLVIYSDDLSAISFAFQEALIASVHAAVQIALTSSAIAVVPSGSLSSGLSTRLSDSSSVPGFNTNLSKDLVSSTSSFLMTEAFLTCTFLYWYTTSIF